MAATYVEAAGKTVLATTGRDRDQSIGSIVFLCCLWFSLFFGVMVLVALIASTAIDGSARFDSNLVTRYSSTLSPERTGFRGVLPRRWVVERTFGWLGQSRRLSKDYERLPATSEAMIYGVMSRLMLRRLARPAA